MDKLKEKIIKNKMTIFFTLLFVLSGMLGAFLGNSFMDVSKKNTPTTAEQNQPKNKIYNFLFLGVDERNGDQGRSDTIIVLSVNFNSKKIGLISIPRDTRVEIPLHGQDKINHAYAYGGINLSINVIEKITGLEINNYVVLNFKNFKKIIDTFGGINIDVPKDMYYRDDYDGENGLIIDLKKGNQTLNGEKAMQFVRYRDEEGDIGRVKRQQLFLEAVISKITSIDTLPNIPFMIKELVSGINTNIGFEDIKTYFSYLQINNTYQIKSISVDGVPETINEISYWIPKTEEFQKNIEVIHNFLLNKTAVEVKKENEKVPNKDLNWQISKLDEENKDRNIDREKEIKEKLLKEERNKAIKEPVYTEESGNDLNNLLIINSQDDTEKLNLILDELQKNEISVSNIKTIKNNTNQNQTVFIINSKNEDLIKRIKQLNFKYSIIYKPSENTQSTLIIGG